MKMILMRWDCQGSRVLRSPARNDPGSGLLHMSGGRLFQSFAVLGKNEYLCTFILERGVV